MITHFLRKLRFFVSFTYIKFSVPLIHGTFHLTTYFFPFWM